MTRVIGRTAGSNLGKPAVMAGVGILLISVLAGLADFGAVKGLVTGGDATTTAHDILASETTFRLAIAAFVVVAVLDVITDFHDIWTAGLVLFGSHLLLVGYLIYRSGFAPKPLGVLVAVAGAGYLVDSFGALLFSDYALSVGAVTFVGEFLLMLWLLLRNRTVASPPLRGRTP
jgi:hypothetical protein